MSFKNLDIKNTYEINNGLDIVREFYIPTLSNCVSYDRIAGYFSSSGLSIAARGIAGLIRNNGKMRLITSPNFTKEDYYTLTNYVKNINNYLEIKFFEDLSNIENEFEKNHVQALGWMLGKGFLEIRLAIPKNESGNKGILHQKIGILKDSDNYYISFSGSNNETASGWMFNSEEFKVFKSWLPIQDEYFQSDYNKFNEIWNKQRDNIDVYNISSAIKCKLIKIGENFDKEKFINKYYRNDTLHKPLNITLFPYQKNAIKQWKDNNYQSLFEMATGTGKTYTALGALYELFVLQDKFITIISTPQNTLSKQWNASVTNIGIEYEELLFADSSNTKWRDNLSNAINKVKIGRIKNLLIYTTHKTSSKKDFVSLFENLNKSIKVCFIGDEAHGLGSNKTCNALLERYDYRIGLSATPQRWFDEEGTDVIRNYFGNNIYRFTIKDALCQINPITGKTFLVNYKYFPIFVNLTENEIERYKELSSKISKLHNMSKNQSNYLKSYENLLFLRANIIKNAENKYYDLDNLITEKQPKDCIVFVSYEQIDQVVNMINEKRLRVHRFTQKQKTRCEKKYSGLSEREFIIQKFKDKDIDVLVAIKCLDEGIDIPTASSAILMANSTNPREYIQRIGRIIRNADNKNVAYVYDFIVEPDFDKLENKCTIEFEKCIFEKELNRVEDMAENAINNSEVFAQISERRRKLLNA